MTTYEFKIGGHLVALEEWEAKAIIEAIQKHKVSKIRTVNNIHLLYLEKHEYYYYYDYKEDSIEILEVIRGEYRILEIYKKGHDRENEHYYIEKKLLLLEPGVYVVKVVEKHSFYKNINGKDRIESREQESVELWFVLESSDEYRTLQRIINAKNKEDIIEALIEYLASKIDWSLKDLIKQLL